MTEKRGVEQFISEHAPPQELEHARDKIAQLEKRLAEERKRTGEARLQALEIAEAVEAAKPLKMRYTPPKENLKGEPITCVMHATDWHEGEVIDPGETEGLNEFSPDILGKRLELWGEKIISYMQVLRSGYDIPTLHIIGTGDWISGDIHHELQVTNAYPAPRQAVEAGYKFGTLVRMMAPHFETVMVDFLSTDNHGRLTRKNQASQGGENNYGYITGALAKQYCSEVANVTFSIHATPTMLLEIGPERYLCFHGHQLRGWSGIPYYGFDRRVMVEAVKRMNVPDLSFTKLITGHFHTAVDSMHWMIGGSASGTTTFDHTNGRHAPAHQTSWLVHPRHGQLAFTRWWLDEKSSPDN